jgi:hypothetical protein
MCHPDCVIGWGDLFPEVLCSDSLGGPENFPDEGFIFFPQRKAPLITATDNLPDGFVGVAYSFQFAATGVPAPEWSHTGNLPNGLTLDEQGLLSGTPTQSGDFTFTIKAENTEGYDEQQISIQISRPLLPGEPYIAVFTAFADPGDEVDVQIRVYNNPGFASMFMKIAFPDELTLLDYTLAANVEDNFTAPANLSLFPNHVFMGWSGRTQPITQDGTLLTLKFKVCDDMDTNQPLPVTVTFESAMFGAEKPSDINNEELDFGIVNGHVRVQPKVMGDIGANGRITSGSATILARYIIGDNVIIDLRAADVDCNGVVDIRDLTRFAQLLVGIETQTCPHNVNGCTRCNPNM